MITTRAPLRIPLGGGGTDLPSYYREHGGFILSAGIDKYVFIQLNTLKVEPFIRVKYSQTERVDDPSQIQHPLLRESLLHTGIDSGLEIGAMADVPGRTGLGSSGSFTVALLAALREHQRLPMPRQQLAEEAFHVETVRAGQPAGKHDHYLGAFGGLTCLEIDTAGDVTVSALDISLHTLDELRNSMVVFFTGMVRESFDILSQQEADTAAGEPDVVDSLHQVKELGLQIRSALQEGNPDRFGELLHVHWEAKKRRSTKVSNPKIDAYYETGRRQGALGGKLLGAGGGGFLMFYCPAEFRGQLREAMSSEGLQEMSFQFDTDGAKVLMNA
ncbi:MAG: galactokinase [Candidatus Latescibacteria bacterium]|jgi:D-glycero-alpha-D-manno-heptose-7-phosphate kinase|nr:galactokinase [Candidatus Latescibacterota bacterium]MEE3336393.1 galactokinase [Candidatus Latescibacterota bacterium]